MATMLSVCENCERMAILFCLECGGKCCLHCNIPDDSMCTCSHTIELHVMDPDMMSDYETWVAEIKEV